MKSHRWQLTLRLDSLEDLQKCFEPNKVVQFPNACDINLLNP